MHRVLGQTIPPPTPVGPELPQDEAKTDLPMPGEDNRKMRSLYLSIMDRMGIKLERFGDAKTRLQRL